MVVKKGARKAKGLLFKLGKLKRSYVILAFLLIFAAAGSYWLAFSRAVGTATLTLSPASQSIALGGQVIVTVYANAGTESFNAVQADLTYDSTKLQFVSIDTAVGPFSMVAQKSGGAGKVNIAVGASPAVTGSQIVARITFNSLATGTTSISYATTSAIVRSTDNSNILGTTSGGSYTITDTTAPTTPTNLTSPSKTTTTVNLSWTAASDNVGVTGYKIYRGGVQVGTATTTSYSVTGLSPGTAYTFTVSAYDAAQNTSAQSTGLTVSTQYQSGDVNGDGHVTVTDLSILATNFQKTGMTRAQGDLNGDTLVNVYDLSIMASNWGV